MGTRGVCQTKGRGPELCTPEGKLSPRDVCQTQGRGAELYARGVNCPHGAPAPLHVQTDLDNHVSGWRVLGAGFSLLEGRRWVSKGRGLGCSLWGWISTGDARMSARLV